MSRFVRLPLLGIVSTELGIWNRKAKAHLDHGTGYCGEAFVQISQRYGLVRQGSE